MQDVQDGSVEAEKSEDAAAEVTATDDVREERRSFFRSEAMMRALYLVTGALAIGLIFRQIQFSTDSVCCGDFDGYYHIRWSRLLWEGIRQGHFPPVFTWLPLTTLNPQNYVDHHLLFHLLQMPFTWFGDLNLGAKVAATLFASLAVFACYWLIVHYRIRYALCWLVALLACSAPFLYRLNMAKAPPLAIIFMVIGIYLLFEGKYLWLAPVMFLFVWSYSLFPTLIIATVIWTAVTGWSERRFEWRPLLWITIGTAAGLILNPYFPKNIMLFGEHLSMKLAPMLKGQKGFSTSVGSEWYPYESWYFLWSCVIAFISMVTGYIAFDWSDKKRAARPLFFLVFATILMIFNFNWRRFVEYWPPFAVLFAAFSLQPIFEGVRSSIHRLPVDVLDELQPFLDRTESSEKLKQEREREIWKMIVASVVAVFLGVILFFNVRDTIKSIQEDSKPDHYRAGMEWIRQNVPAGQIIFNTDWDDFPKMFYYDTTHSYISGLDPTYLLDKNPELAKLYENITLGREKDPGPIIRDRFGARYVFTDNEEVHDDFYNNAIDSGWFDKVYEDSECTILQLRETKGTPPPEVEETTPVEENPDEGQPQDESNGN